MPVPEATPARRRRTAHRRDRDGTAAHRPALALDSAVDPDAAGLIHEVRLVRAAIRRLAGGDDAGDMKMLAELRHQVAILCTALKTQRDLDGRGAEAASADLAELLEELGDKIGVPS